MRDSLKRPKCLRTRPAGDRIRVTMETVPSCLKDRLGRWGLTDAASAARARTMWQQAEWADYRPRFQVSAAQFEPEPMGAARPRGSLNVTALCSAWLHPGPRVEFARTSLA